jgi:glutamate-ammonia-ligase adenylyltransferase
LADVEWAVQLLQLQHAGRHPELRTTRTLAALTAAVAAGLIDQDDADTLALAWRTATQVRGAVMLVRGKASDSIPTQSKERARVARLIHPDSGDAEAFLDEYLRVTRRARAVVERVFYG